MNPIDLPLHQTKLANCPGFRRTPQISRNFDRGRTTASIEAIPIIAICHLGWDWVWQRPQQFLSRMAKTHPLLFVELHRSPVRESFFQLRTWEANPSVRILKIQLPAERWHDGAFIDGERRRLLLEVMSGDLGDEFAGAILWMNDPMATPAYVGHLGESMVVYDCMDELTQFAGAPTHLAVRERELVARADVIFCGGQKMRAKRLPVNRNTHFYGTGVDCSHFAAAMRPGPAHPALAHLAGPVLGYFGVIDERIDYQLLEYLADANPGWQIAMLGPFAKVEVATLPARPNLHWLGAMPYAELPALCRGLDVCLMPFALNAATEYINPTKALEYMAAGKPVVSTALDEVKSNFAVAARIAATHREFAALCAQEVERPSKFRIRNGLELAAANTWERIVENMNRHMQDVAENRRTPEAFGRANAASGATTVTAPSYV